MHRAVNHALPERHLPEEHPVVRLVQADIMPKEPAIRLAAPVRLLPFQTEHAHLALRSGFVQPFHVTPVTEHPALLASKRPPPAAAAAVAAAAAAVTAATAAAPITAEAVTNKSKKRSPETGLLFFI